VLHVMTAYKVWGEEDHAIAEVEGERYQGNGLSEENRMSGAEAHKKLEIDKGEGRQRFES
jgi:hypothetical protein